MQPDNQRQLSAFDADLARIGKQDCTQLNQLTLGVGWPHRPEDLRHQLELGQGYIIRDAIRRPIGSGMYFPVTDSFATIGMMITTPRLQAEGAGRWILQRLLGDCPVDSFLLNATRQGLRLYMREGFTAIRPISHQQGRARAIELRNTLPGTTLRPMEPGDLPAVAAWDADAFGAPREAVLTTTYRRSDTATVLERAGRFLGFAMTRPFGRGRVIGPLVATGPAEAMSLVAPLINAHVGEFMRVDTPFEDTEFNAFLAAAGLGVFDTVIEMHRGEILRDRGEPRIYGLAAQSLG